MQPNWRQINFLLAPQIQSLNGTVWQRTAAISEKTRAIGMVWALSTLAFEIGTLEDVIAMPRPHLDEKARGADLIYQYFPLSEGEVVSNVWIRRDRRSSRLDGAILVSSTTFTCRGYVAHMHHSCGPRIDDE